MTETSIPIQEQVQAFFYGITGPILIEISKITDSIFNETIQHKDYVDITTLIILVLSIVYGGYKFKKYL